MGAYDDILENKPGAYDDIVPPSRAHATGKNVPPATRSSKFYRGVGDPIFGTYQLAYNLLPESAQRAHDKLNNWAQDNGLPIKRIPEGGLNTFLNGMESDYNASRDAAGDKGFDWWRLGGNVASPVNALVASKLPVTASGVVGQALQGARAGAAGALMQPVYGDDAPYGMNKGIQALSGAVFGGVFTPIASAVAKKVVVPAYHAVANKLSSLFGKHPVQFDATPGDVDRIIGEALDEANQKIDDIPADQLDNLRLHVTEALKQGKNLDPAALMRKQDFESAGVQPLRSWVTRDPEQFAQEMNLRGLESVGKPLMQRHTAVNQFMQKQLRDFAAGAKSTFDTGESLVQNLKDVDEAMRRQVTSAYTQARNSAGAELDVPLTGLAQDYARIVGDYADNVPPAIRLKFSQLGLDPMKPSNQSKVFTIQDADELLKVINKNDPGFSNKPMSSALGEIRSAVKNAVNNVDASGGPFAPAVKLASQRFKIQEAVPALDAAIKGSVAPDDFVKRFVIGGKVNDVRGMSQLLDPSRRQEVRSQIGSYLQRAGFGENLGGDKSFSAERFSKVLREFGDEKLGAFFSQQEINGFKRLARIGTYVHSEPNMAAVNRSNTAAAMTNMLGGHAQQLSRTAAVINTLAAPIKNARSVNAALNVNAATKPMSQLTQDQMRFISSLVAGGAAGGGLLAATPLR